MLGGRGRDARCITQNKRLCLFSLSFAFIVYVTAKRFRKNSFYRISDITVIFIEHLYNGNLVVIRTVFCLIPLYSPPANANPFFFATSIFSFLIPIPHLLNLLLTLFQPSTHSAMTSADSVMPLMPNVLKVQYRISTSSRQVL